MAVLSPHFALHHLIEVVVLGLGATALLLASRSIALLLPFPSLAGVMRCRLDLSFSKVLHRLRAVLEDLSYFLIEDRRVVD